MAINDLFTVQYRYLLSARVCTGIVAYRATFAEVLSTLSRSLDRAFNDEIVPLLQACWSNEVSIQSTYVLGVNPAGKIPSYTYQTDDTGSIAAQAYPGDSPLVIKMITDAPNSRHNGRLYLSGFADTNVTAQVLNAAYLAGPLAALATALKGTIVDPDSASRIWQPVVLTREDLGIPIIPPTSFDVINTVTQNTIFSQRRRRTRRTEIGVPPP